MKGNLLFPTNEIQQMYITDFFMTTATKCQTYATVKVLKQEFFKD